MSTISASTTSTTAYKVTADTTGTLVLQTGSTPTTAVTVGTDQSVTLAGTLAVQSQNISPYTGFKNRIINGAMMIDQRNAAAEVALPGPAYTYTVDRFKCYSTASSKWKAQQVSDAPAGFSYSLKLTSLSANSPASGDEYGIFHVIEGLNVSDLAYGSASASPLTLSFWVKASIAGTYPFTFYYNNGSGYQWYTTTYSIASTNTWTFVTLVIPGNTSQALLATNTFGLNCVWALGNGSGSNTTSTGSWQSSLPKFNTSSSVNLLGTNGATLNITGVQLEKGSTATSFDYRPYGTELALCQRYCFAQGAEGKLYGVFASMVGIAQSGGAQVGGPVQFPQQMRSAPTLTPTGTFRMTAYNTVFTTSLTPSIDANRVTTTGAEWQMSGMSGMTAGNSYYLQDQGSGTAKLVYSAEL